MHRAILLILVPCFCLPAFAQVDLKLTPQSSLVIEGRSTINRFACEAEDLSGEGRLSPDGATAVLRVSVRDLDCGKAQMNRDLQEALKAKHHPEIRFELVDANHGVSNGPLQVVGQLAIAGVRRTVHLEPVAEETAPGAYRLRGEKQLRMSDFGVDPPTALAGLIKVHDDIVVRFDLIARTSDPAGPLDPGITDSHRRDGAPGVRKAISIHLSVR